VFCRSLFVPLSFFFWPLCSLISFIYGFWLLLWYLQTLLIFPVPPEMCPVYKKYMQWNVCPYFLFIHIMCLILAYRNSAFDSFFRSLYEAISFIDSMRIFVFIKKKIIYSNCYTISKYWKQYFLELAFKKL
jgi:hypothetical protein